MDRMAIEIYCASLNFRLLDKTSLAALERTLIPGDESTIHSMISMFGFPVDQIAVIQKCNAVMLLVVISCNISDRLVRNRIIDVWDKISFGGILDLLEHIHIFEGIEAIKYLGECAIGLHSVVIGDSQVYAQIYKPIADSARLQKSSCAFTVICSWLERVLSLVKERTNLHAGNTSLERLACEKVDKILGNKNRVAVVGLGDSGRLIVKILSSEKNMPIIVSNRTESIAQEIATKYNNVKHVQFGDLGFLTEVNGVIIALDNTFETREYGKKLIEAFQQGNSPCKIVVDISSPTILDRAELDKLKIIFLDLEDLSIEARETLKKREAEANRARQIVHNLIPQMITDLNNAISRTRIEEQKQRMGTIRLDKKKLELLETRDIVMLAMREHLHGLGFVEIHTPCIVGMSTDPPKVDSGHIFEVSWPGGGAFLRQSNQLYKQIIVISGQPKVFEIGPFWRSEAERDHRHLEETIGLDVELSNPDNLQALYRLAYALILKAANILVNSPIRDLRQWFLPNGADAPVLEYKEAIHLLNTSGFKISFGEDLGILGEARLGWIAKKNWSSDVVIVHHYPDTVKKFYTLRNDNGSTETFDIILFGWEVVSGALREIRVEVIERQMKLSGLNPALYDFYLSAIKGAPPHGGFGMGFDRIIAKLLGLDSITDAVLFPRTFEKLIP